MAGPRAVRVRVRRVDPADPYRALWSLPRADLVRVVMEQDRLIERLAPGRGLASPSVRRRG